MKQERYYVNGYQPPVGVDNRNTVREYQRSLNVAVDGIWGKETDAAYKKILHSPPREERQQTAFEPGWMDNSTRYPIYPSMGSGIRYENGNGYFVNERFMEKAARDMGRAVSILGPTASTRDKLYDMVNRSSLDDKWKNRAREVVKFSSQDEQRKLYYDILMDGMDAWLSPEAWEQRAYNLFYEGTDQWKTLFPVNPQQYQGAVRKWIEGEIERDKQLRANIQSTQFANKFRKSGVEVEAKPLTSTSTVENRTTKGYAAPYLENFTTRLDNSPKSIDRVHSEKSLLVPEYQNTGSTFEEWWNQLQQTAGKVWDWIQQGLSVGVDKQQGYHEDVTPTPRPSPTPTLRPTPKPTPTPAPITTPTPTTPLDEFIEYLEEQYRNKCTYVWGAQGKPSADITMEWIEKCEKDLKNRNRVIAAWEARKDAGGEFKAYDCSGLGMHWLQDITGYYDSDLSANGMMRQTTRINEQDLKRGDWVFRTYKDDVYKDGKLIAHKGDAYHIGYVVDDLYVIEAKGRDDGVVCRPLNAEDGYWDCYGRPNIFNEWIE